MLYTSGRVWIEALRIDTANHIGPFRLNVWTSIIVFTVAAAFFFATRKRARSEEPVAEATDEESAETEQSP
jgi:prolipoprotein diacylglyceryltransferase